MEETKEILKAQTRFMAGIGYLALALLALDEARDDEVIDIDTHHELTSDLKDLMRRFA